MLNVRLLYFAHIAAITLIPQRQSLDATERLSAGAMRTSNTGTIAGRVRNLHGRPLQSVKVWVSGTESFWITDSSGTFIMRSVPPGEVTLPAARLCYERTEISGVHVLADSTTRQDVGMTPAPLREVTHAPPGECARQTAVRHARNSLRNDYLG